VIICTTVGLSESIYGQSTLNHLSIYHFPSFLIHACKQFKNCSQEGIFPLPITQPMCGPNTKIIIVNSMKYSTDLFGHHILQGALLAYPNQIHIVHTLSRETVVHSEDDLYAACPGNRICMGRISKDVIMEAFEMNGGVSRTGYSRKVVVCGPMDFSGTAYSLLVDETYLFHHTDVSILPSTSYV
jgi:hypothetical protein